MRTRPNHERWLVSYADFITLLFAFFVVMFASSQGDRNKAERLAGAITAAFQQLGLGHPATPGPAQAARVERSPYPPPSQLDQLAQELKQALAPEMQRGEAALRSTPDGLVISLREIGFFESGSARLRSNSQQTFGRVAVVLQARRCKLRIEGHTDTVPIHNPQFQSNWELSTARATELVQLLIQRYQYDPALLSAGGYSEYQPVAPNVTAEGRSQNRRVDLVILNSGQISARADAVARDTKKNNELVD